MNVQFQKIEWSGKIKNTLKTYARVLWFWLDRLKFRIYATKSEDLIIFTYSMGKVGSTSIFKLLKKTRYASGVQHLHFLNKNSINFVEKLHREAGFKWGPEHLLATKNFHAIAPSIDPKRIRLITAVRDPVAFAVSNYFQNPYFFNGPSLEKDKLNEEEVIKYIESDIIDVESKSIFYWRNWFEEQISCKFGINLLEQKFDTENGWSIIEAHDVQIGLIQLEKLGVNFEGFTEALLGTSFSLPQNKANQRILNTPQYPEIVRKVKIPTDKLDQIYSNEYVRFFYSDEQIRAFKKRWSSF
jgi:hypothetical protein